MPVSLTPRERAHLKARAHSMEPVVHVGSSGVTDALIAEIDRALEAHELIKIRAGGADREARADMLDEICRRSDATSVQTVGKVMVLWRPRKVDAEAPPK
jgi:putative YhbY family RNA-binding protein